MQLRVLRHTVGRRPEDEVRRAEPLTFGVPLPHGAVREDSSWSCDHSEKVQVRALDRWSDGSIRWALVDLRADLAGSQELILEVQQSTPSVTTADDERSPSISLSDTIGQVVVETGVARFEMRAGGCFPFDAVDVGGQTVLDPAGSGLVITDARGTARHAEIRLVEIEERGPLRSVVKCTGSVQVDGGRTLSLVGRLHFFAGLPTVRVLVTLTNTDRARHPGGFWDLGDAGSILIKDASLAFQLAASNEGIVELYASPEVGAPWTKFDTPFEIYQDSSGGEHWQSNNHLNRERRVANSFRGYRLQAGSRAQAGLRATPILALARGAAGVAVTTPHFWQNFPKAIETDGTGVTLRLFPKQYDDLHEIQGGEQKTHEVFVAFGPDGVTSVPLAWCRTRTVAGVVPEWCLESGAVPFLAPLDADHAGLVTSAVAGSNRFELKREVIDQFGWRHFGEIYGDHEGVNHKGATPLVSHYNNQYDPVAGFAYQFLRTGDARWQQMMCELAAHVVDIDLYHTSKDKSAYSCGMFWHTYHYGDADTATHRTFPLAGKGRIHGGGPSAGHNYTTGLLMHYFLTGDAASRAAVLQLARYVVDLDDGRKNILRFLATSDTGLATLSAPRYYGPGRGGANSVNALIDGHRLSGDVKYLSRVEHLIRRTVHPADDIQRHELDVPEERWFYTMFLQALGKYLAYKTELGQIDEMYSYGRASLLHYARWMAANEHPYLSKPDKLRYPTETWPAQDVRKSDIFYLAARYTTADERKQFLARAREFYGYSIETLRRMPSRTLARPVVIMLTSGYMHACAHQASSDEAAVGPAQDFGQPAVFISQRERAERHLKWLGALSVLATIVSAWLFWPR